MGSVIGLGSPVHLARTDGKRSLRHRPSAAVDEGDVNGDVGMLAHRWRQANGCPRPPEPSHVRLVLVGVLCLFTVLFFCVRGGTGEGASKRGLRTWCDESWSSSLGCGVCLCRRCHGCRRAHGWYRGRLCPSSSSASLSSPAQRKTEYSNALHGASGRLFGPGTRPPVQGLRARLRMVVFRVLARPRWGRVESGNGRTRLALHRAPLEHSCAMGHSARRGQAG